MKIDGYTRLAAVVANPIKHSKMCIRDSISSIEEEMLANGSDFGKLATLQKELDEKNEDLLEKYERYEYLSELV